jgi:hypothetical protein
MGSGIAMEDPDVVHYYGGCEPSGDPSTGLPVTLLKFEPFEDIGEPDVEGSAEVCFYSLAPPFEGYFENRIAIKFADGSILGHLDGPIPGCDTVFSPTDVSTWGHVKILYR